jgi:hypothetical protein
MTERAISRHLLFIEVTARIRAEFFNCFGSDNISIDWDEPMKFRASTNLPPERRPVTVDVDTDSVWLILGEQGGMDFVVRRGSDIEGILWLIKAARKGTVSETWWLSKKGYTSRHELKVEYEGITTGPVRVGCKRFAAEIKTVTYQPW